jgi:hypothetical protein
MNKQIEVQQIGIAIKTDLGHYSRTKIPSSRK